MEKHILLTEKEITTLRILSEMYLSKIDEKAGMNDSTLKEVKANLISAKEKLSK